MVLKEYKNVLCVLLIGMLGLGQAIAQSFETFEISGTVSDQEETLPFATVILWQDSVFIHGLHTDFDGIFSFTNLQAGRYTLEVKYVGYETFTEVDFLVDSLITDWNVILDSGPDLVGDVPYTIIPRPIHKLEMVNLSKDSFGLSGLVLDSKGEILPFASISLFQQKDLIAETHANFDGLFSIQVNEAGFYILKVEFISLEIFQKEVVIDSFIQNERIILSDSP